MADQGSAPSERPTEPASASRAPGSSAEPGPSAPEFRPLARRQGFRITDPVERVEFDLYTPGDVAPARVAPDRAPVEWCFPVDSAAGISTSRVTVPLRTNVNVRAPDGAVVATSEGLQPVSVDEPGAYTLEIENAPMKLYLACHGRVAVFPEQHRTEIVFRDADRWFVGARSLHEHPARTITTTDDPRDLMLAVSEFGAALKTTSVERSFPSLRGYPPLLERGDEFDAPGGIQSPDTGVSLRVRPELSDVFTVAPLAYYLGASVEPSADGVPRLATDEGFSYPLVDSPAGGFGATVGAVFKHVFTLDCLTRTHGFYPVETAIYDEARERLPAVDFARLYDRSPAAQLAEYLQIPFEDVEPLRPAWRLHATVVPTAERIATLPHLAADLATVSCRETPAAADAEGDDAPAGTAPDREAVDGVDAEGTTASVSDFLRSPRAGSTSGSEDPDGGSVPPVETVDLPDRDAVTQTYIGEGLPLGGNKAIEEAFERKLAVHSSLPSHLSTTIVCNDPEMTDELAVSEFYTGRDTFEIDVDVRTETTRGELREVLAGDTDFVHFVGHVTAEGLQCVDGYLDAADLEPGDMSVPAFLLNGCQSYRQGKRLVERGAVAGIVTTADVINTAATEIGHHFARLLNVGWPLDAAVEVIREQSLVGTQYLVVGDGTAELVNPSYVTPNIAHVTPATVDSVDDPRVRQALDGACETIDRDSDAILSDSDGAVPERSDPLSADRYTVEIHAYPTRRAHLGALFTPYVGGNDQRYLASGRIETFDVTSGQLDEFLSTDVFPVSVTPSPPTGSHHVSLQWSGDLDLNE